MIVKDILSNVVPSIWPFVLFVSVIFISLRVAYLFKGSRKVVIYKEILTLVFIIYILCLYHVLIIKNTGYDGVNFTPFKEMFRYAFASKNFIKNILGNILIFIPFGFGASYYLNTKKAVTPTIIIIVVAACIEGIQYLTAKVFDVDDILLCTLGGFLGYLIFVAFGAVRSKLPRFMKSDWFINFITILIVILVVLFALGIDIFKFL